MALYGPANGFNIKKRVYMVCPTCSVFKFKLNQIVTVL
jgi:hypothetical protein